MPFNIFNQRGNMLRKSHLNLRKVSGEDELEEARQEAGRPVEGLFD